MHSIKDNVERGVLLKIDSIAPNFLRVAGHWLDHRRSRIVEPATRRWRHDKPIETVDRPCGHDG
jgi:hypothetical protein